ncbi:MAG TPA: SMI1/KNR4 family protein, partial [Myxococcaceae bacterium]|nr:SMI1/KNR4 family protein [Myxococcaceae bacterium]
AGYFAFALVFGVEAGTEWDIVKCSAELPAGFIPVSDTGTGDYYGFVVKNDECERSVAFWDHETGTVREGVFPDFYEMLLARALTP